MLDAGIDRTACVVAVGGGVVTDLAGFVAATYMRGVDYINVATSLLAQVDSSIGGKTGVDVPRGKNLVGAFHQPSASLINTAALASLPAREFTNGMAELVKHAVIADTGLFEKLEKFAAAGGKNLPEDALEDSIRIKAEVVEADEKEAGMRQVLNFGHTFGHAIEKAEGYALPHGFCVSIGMALEAALAHRLTGFPAAETERLKKLLSALGLPVVPPRPFETIAAHIASDKKSREGKTRFALPKRIGEMEAAGGAWSLAVETVLIRAVYERESRQGAA
jgi:3-dehydroquinate synthase